MILHGVTIRNWRNISQLVLDDLNVPLLVLYGPNRTGKSSIVEAIRCCLFDYDHDSSAGPIRGAAPWSTKASPEVTVEFEVANERLRLNKRFSPRKDGEATLERVSANGSASIVERGKEASREARSRLKEEKSNEGLNQLLWLPQGVTHVPESKSLAPGLRKRFESVLGSMLTAHDIDFSEELLLRCRGYFSPKTRKELKKSPVVQLRNRVAELEEQVSALKTESQDSESRITEHDRHVVDQAEQQKFVDESIRQVESLTRESKEIDEKRRSLESARRTLKELSAAEENARAAVEKHRQLSETLSQTDQEIRKTREALYDNDARKSDIDERIQSVGAELAAVIDDVSAIDREAREVADKRRLTSIHQKLNDISTKISEAQQLESRIDDNRNKLSRLVAPDSETIRSLQSTRQQIDKLRALIDAAALRLEIEATDSQDIELKLDADPQPNVRVSDGGVREWKFRQWLELRIESFGTIRVVRGQSNISLDEAASSLSQHERDFADTLAGFDLDARDETWLEQLTMAREKHETLQARIGDDESRMNAIAPDGVELFRGDRQRLESERAGIIERSPDLAEWVPNESEIDAKESEVNERRTDVKSRRTGLENSVKDLRQRAEEIADSISNLKIKLATLVAESNATQDRVTELGDKFSLTQSLASAVAQREEAESEVTDAALTTEEEQVFDRLEQEKEARDRRRKRLQETATKIHGIREVLKARSGLHERLTRAEAELEQTRTQLADSEQDAEAHQLLLDVFERCRDDQVQRTIGPLAECVLDWTTRLGLGDYSNIHFETDDYLPTGLTHNEIESAVSIADESFGTIEQLAILIRLAAGRLLAGEERQVAILDDPLTHADSGKHRAILNILEEVSRSEDIVGSSRFAPLQLMVFTCHPEKYDHLRNAKFVNLDQLIERAQS